MRHRVHVNTGDGEPESTGQNQADSEANGTNETPIDDSASAGGEELAALRAEVEQLRAELAEEKDQRLRGLADFQNFRRRREEETRQISQFANRELIIAILPVLDNFERALAASETNQSYDALIGGVKLTLRQLQDFLKKNGVDPIEAEGAEFDPNLHEAVQSVDDSGQPDNTVVQELQRGYTMHDRVLRPSMVKVARNG